MALSLSWEHEANTLLVGWQSTHSTGLQCPAPGIPDVNAMILRTRNDPLSRLAGGAKRGYDAVLFIDMPLVHLQAGPSVYRPEPDRVI
eukprot:scaffold587_cov339-Pavlova_lutheri.AAC.61